MFSDEALSRILTEADRIVQDAQELLNRATATGEADLIEAAHAGTIQHRVRLNDVELYGSLRFAFRPHKQSIRKG